MSTPCPRASRPAAPARSSRPRWRRTPEARRVARLKVFITSDGLTDFVVATTSKAKALAAWGIRQDVFKEGAARETDDPALVKAASARPGEVLRRPAGTRGELEKLKPAKRRE